MSVTVHNQTELDQALADQALADQAETIYIESDTGVRLHLRASGSSRVVARGSSRVEASGSSRVVARESSRVVARDSSRVETWDTSRVEAWDSSRVEASDSSSVVAWDSSSVVARDTSRVVAWGSSRVVARGSSRVEASGSSRVEASGSSRVEAWGSSRVEASKYVAVHLHSQKVSLKGGTVINLTKIDFSDPKQWCKYYGVVVKKGIAYLFKAVNDEWSTDRGTVYSPGSKPVAEDWDTTPSCGGGLHFCAHPVLSEAYFRGASRYVKVGVRLDELVTLGDKVKAKRVVVACVEVDRFGAVVEAVG